MTKPRFEPGDVVRWHGPYNYNYNYNHAEATEVVNGDVGSILYHEHCKDGSIWYYVRWWRQGNETKHLDEPGFSATFLEKLDD